MTEQPLIPRLSRRHLQPAADPVVPFTVTTAAAPANRWVEIRGPGRGIRLLRDGAHDFHGISELVKTIVRPGMSDTEKAVAVYRFCMRHAYSFSMGWGEYDMNRFINAYGYSFCWGQADFQHLLMEAAGLRVRAPSLKGHSSGEVLLDGAWRAVDAYVRLLAPAPDLNGFATGRELHKHPELFTALFHPERAATLADYWALWAPGGTYEPRLDSHAMMLNLRRGESLRLHHANRGLWCLAPREPADYVNGDWTYEPVLDADHLAKETECADNVHAEDGALRASNTAKPAVLEYRVQCPYPLVAGSLSLAFSGAARARISISSDQRRTWTDLWDGRAGRHTLPLDPHLSVRLIPPGSAPATLSREAVHDLLVRIRWEGRALLTQAKLAFVCQAHAPAVPRLEPGLNRCLLVGGAAGASVEYAWDEFPGASVSEAAPLEGDPVTLRAAVHNPGPRVARQVPVRFVDSATGAVVASALIKAIPPGQTRSVTRRWTAVARGDRSSITASVGIPGYVRTTLKIETGRLHRRADKAGELSLVVRPRPDPRFGDSLVWIGRDSRCGDDQLVIRAAVAHCAPDPSSGRLYVCDVPLGADVTPFLGHPDQGGKRLAPSRRLEGILPGEFAVAEWVLDARALPADGAVWVEAVCDDTVAPGRRRLLGTRSPGFI